MLLYKFRKKSSRYLKYLLILYKSRQVPVKEKIIYVDVSEIVINRYLYSFLKMLDISGYTVYLPGDPKIIDVLSKTKGENKYASWLISDKIVKFGEPLEVNIIINASQLSNNYFSNVLPETSYHVPMSCYPGFYQNYQFLNQKTENKKRKNSAFMSGNIDPAYYNNIADSKYFSQPSRKQIADYLAKQNYNFEVNSFDDLNAFIRGAKDRKVIIINTVEAFRIDLKTLPDILQSFNFYIAMPGIVIPQSHNLIEAMACGCIPIIHNEYAELMKPQLIHEKNAFVFEKLAELNELIKEIFMLPEDRINKMREEVFKYYHNFLSPEAVVQTIESDDFEKIYIQAEHSSLRLLEN